MGMEGRTRTMRMPATNRTPQECLKGLQMEVSGKTTVIEWWGDLW